MRKVLTRTPQMLPNQPGRSNLTAAAFSQQYPPGVRPQMAIKAPVNPGQNPSRVPQYGSQPLVDGQAMTIEQIRQYTQWQKRTKGFAIPVAVGDDNRTDIDISGTAKMMLGFALLNQTDRTQPISATSMTMTINNEVVIEETDPNFFGSLFTNEEYYYFPRPLLGRDKVAINFTGVSNEVISMSVYYI